MKKSNRHEFALCITGSDYRYDQHAHVLTLYASDSITRVVSILRLKPHDTAVFFDDSSVYYCTISVITKKNIICAVTRCTAVKKQTPGLHMLLPVLEREALEDTLYMATVYGVTSIQLVQTSKSRHSLTDKEYLRLEKIARSAAEQSKQFSLPEINRIITLEDFLFKKIPDYKQYKKLWCDKAGVSILKEIKHDSPDTQYLLTLGPEGDFTEHEKELLKNYFKPVKLTDTVLRAKDAAHLALGVIRLIDR